MHRSIVDIKQDMLRNISNTEDKTENSFIHDALAPASIEFFTFYRLLEDVRDKLDIENLEGGELEKHIKQRVPTITRRLATKSLATVTINGDNGVLINKGDLVSAGSISFEVTETVEIGNAGKVDVEVICTELGSIGNVPAESIDSLPTSIPGVTSIINENAAYGGHDEEDDESLLERYYERSRTPPTSGNPQHYKNWAKEVSGVGDARVISLWNGNGTVKVVIIDSNNQPITEEFSRVIYDHIESQRPVGAEVTVVSATPRVVDVDLNIIISEDFALEQTITKVTESIDNYLRDVAFEVDFVSYARVGKAILETEGVLDYSNLRINNSVANIDLDYEEVATLGEVVISE